MSTGYYKNKDLELGKNLNTKDLGHGSWHQGRETQIVGFQMGRGILFSL